MDFIASAKPSQLTIMLPRFVVASIIGGCQVSFAKDASTNAGKWGYKSSMRILITNDDGIEAPGLDALQKIASDLSDDVWVIAPETDQSGAAHSLTLHEPLRLQSFQSGSSR